MTVNSNNAFQGGSYDSKTAVITRLEGVANCVISISDGGESLTIPILHLKRVSPMKKDKVKITSGEFKGQVGSLITVSDGEGVVRLESGADLKVFQMDCLGKFVG